MSHPMYEALSLFEYTMATWCGSKYAIGVDCCSNALFLCCKYLKVDVVRIPKLTHPGVPCAVIHAGGKVEFEDQEWKGSYLLEPYPICDSARRLRRGMHIRGQFTCLSFHSIKHLKIGRGGMILTDDAEAKEWFCKARYYGMNPKTSEIEMVGWNMMMTPEQASRGMMLMDKMPDDNEDLDYPLSDISNAYMADRTST